MELDGKPGDVVLKGKSAFVLCGNVVYETAKGKLRNTSTLDFTAEGLVVSGGKIFAYSSGFLKEVE